MTNYQDNTIKCRCESGFIGEYCEKGRPFMLFQKRIYKLGGEGGGGGWINKLPCIRFTVE